MKAKSVFTMEVLSMMAATGLFAASNGFAADVHGTSQSEEVNAEAMSGDLKSPETAAPQRQVVDQEGNVYLLVPLKTHDGKVTIDFTTPYTNPTSH